jgi:hypothetical protein
MGRLLAEDRIVAAREARGSCREAAARRGRAVIENFRQEAVVRVG